MNHFRIGHNHTHLHNIAREHNETVKTSSIQNNSVLVESVLDLIFMRDLSHLLTYCSMEFQRFDVLPFYPMNIAEQVLSLLITSSESFNKGEIPEKIPLHTNPEN